jgi:hypothetical protein
MTLNGYQRLGIIASVLWMLSALFYFGFVTEFQYDGLPGVFHNPDELIITFAGPPFVWLLVYITSALRRWVKKGFKTQ